MKSSCGVNPGDPDGFLMARPYVDRMDSLCVLTCSAENKGEKHQAFGQNVSLILSMLIDVICQQYFYALWR